MKKQLLIISSLALVLSGCNTVFGSKDNLMGAMNDFLSFATVKDNGGYYSASDKKQNTGSRSIVVNHDVDTVAARLKHRFKFKSETEVAQLNNGSIAGEYREAMVRDGGFVWTSQAGSYYKMGDSISKNTRVVLEVVKDGAKRTKLKMTYWTTNNSNFNADKSMENIKKVANGA